METRFTADINLYSQRTLQEHSMVCRYRIAGLALSSFPSCLYLFGNCPAMDPIWPIMTINEIFYNREKTSNDSEIYYSSSNVTEGVMGCFGIDKFMWRYWKLLAVDIILPMRTASLLMHYICIKLSTLYHSPLIQIFKEGEMICRNRFKAVSARIFLFVLETICVIIRLNNLYCFPIVEFR